MSGEPLDPAIVQSGTPEQTGLPDYINKGAVAATATFTLIATISGAVAALGGGGPRILVNHPLVGFAAIALVAAGIALGLVGALILFPGASNVQQRNRAILLALASLLILLGFLAGLWGTAMTASTSDQPTITATLSTDPSLVLSGDVSTGAIASNERLFVEIRGYLIDPFGPGNNGQGRDAISELLFATQAGPKTNGTVVVPFTLGVRPGLYELIQVAAWTPGAPQECRDTPEGALVACLSIRMPVSAKRPPSLDISFEETGPSRVAVIHLTANTTDRDAMVLTVVGKLNTGGSSLRSQTLVTANSGLIDRTIRVPIGDQFHDVCAFVRNSTLPDPSPPACPASVENASVWARAVPTAN